MGAVIQMLADGTETSGLLVVVEVAQAELTAVETQIFLGQYLFPGFFHHVLVLFTCQMAAQEGVLVVVQEAEGVVPLLTPLPLEIKEQQQADQVQAHHKLVVVVVVVVLPVSQD